MQSYKLHVPGAGDAIGAIRWELFIFKDIVDVALTEDPEELVVIFEGRPRPDEWIAALRAAGYATASLTAAG